MSAEYESATQTNAPVFKGEKVLFLFSIPGTLKDTIRQLLGSIDDIDVPQEDLGSCCPCSSCAANTASRPSTTTATARLRLGQYLADDIEGERCFDDALRRFAGELYTRRLQKGIVTCSAHPNRCYRVRFLN